MRIEISHKGQVIAMIPRENTIEIRLDDGRLLHVGPLGMYFKTEVTPDDWIKVVAK